MLAYWFVVRAPDSAERLAQQHLDIIASSPPEFAAFFKAEIAKLAKVVRTAGIEPQ